MEVNHPSEPIRYLHLASAMLLSLLYLSDLSAEVWRRDPSEFLNNFLMGMLWTLVGMMWLMKNRFPRFAGVLPLIALLLLLCNAAQMYLLTGSRLSLLLTAGLPLLLGGYLYRRWKQTEADSV